MTDLGLKSHPTNAKKASPLTVALHLMQHHSLILRELPQAQCPVNHMPKLNLLASFSLSRVCDATTWPCFQHKPSI